MGIALFTASMKMMYGSPVARRVSTSFWNSERASTVPRSDPSLGTAQVELGAVAHRFHELVGDEHAVVEVERLAVEVAARLADLEELLDLGVRDVEVAGGRTAPQRALADRQRQLVHHPDERDDAAGLAVEADRLADAADAAPIGADAAAAARPARHSRSTCRRCLRGCRRRCSDSS